MFSNIPEWLLEYLHSLPKEVAINVLLSSLDLMESYNGNSKTYTICQTLGAKIREEKDNEGVRKYLLPDKEETIKRFS